MNKNAKQRLTDPGKPTVVRTLAEANRVQAENERRVRELKKR